MSHVRLSATAIAAAVLFLTVACSGSPATQQTIANQPPPAGAVQPVDIVLNSDAHPKMGASTVNVTVKHPDGMPVTDAVVTAEFFMPVMASMGKTTTELKPQGNGRYEGPGTLSMAGSWQVTVTAKRGDTTLATRTFNLVAKE